MRAPPRTITEAERRLDDAWAVHRTLLLAEARAPALRDNPQWLLLRMDAFETFHDLFLARCRDVR